MYGKRVPLGTVVNVLLAEQANTPGYGNQGAGPYAAVVVGVASSPVMPDGSPTVLSLLVLPPKGDAFHVSAVSHRDDIVDGAPPLSTFWVEAGDTNIGLYNPPAPEPVAVAPAAPVTVAPAGAPPAPLDTRPLPQTTVTPAAA